MKVCLINNLFPPFDRGGAEKYLEKLERGFLREGHEVFIISTRPYTANFKKRERVYYLKSLYFNISKMPAFLRVFWHFFGFFSFYKYFLVLKIFKKEKPDLVITNNLMGIGNNILLSTYKKKIKHIHVLHDIQLLHPSGLMFWEEENKIDSIFAKLYQRFNIFYSSKLLNVVSPSSWLLEEHLKRGFFKMSNCRTIFNPIEITNTPDGKIQNTGKFTFLYLGQIEKHKGVELLLRTIKEFFRNNLNAQLQIVGSGSQEQNMREVFESDQIKFLGRKEGVEVKKAIIESDCLILSSLCYENSPTVVYEAAEYGIKFIYPNFGGAQEIGGYFEGVPYNPGKKGSLLRAIELAFSQGEMHNFQNKKVLELSTSNYIQKLTSIIS
ncbi:hypothetical protein C0584_03420 [Candidatus Parcubacteria bacterium]|nr:MAG: hypothetical protein C0584_03420 [Candidatus Parcubacteria bacterium]